jgi:hypothetical protein
VVVTSNGRGPNHSGDAGPLAVSPDADPNPCVQASTVIDPRGGRRAVRRLGGALVVGVAGLALTLGVVGPALAGTSYTLERQ